MIENMPPKINKGDQLWTMFGFVFGVQCLLDARRQSVIERTLVVLEEAATFCDGQVLIRVEFDGREK